MKGEAQYKSWTTQQKIDKFSSWMATMAVAEKNNMATMGAMRMSRKQAMEYMQTNGSLQYIYTMM
eukprot:2418296-Heterocapsa_arctica.AAC.1